MDKSLYKGIPFSSSLLDFDQYIVHSHDNKAKLYSLIKDCQITNLKIRCDVWRICLGILNIDSPWEEKVEQIQKEREKYNQLVSKHIKKEYIQELINQKPALAKNPLGKLLISKPAPVVTKQETDDKFLEEEIRKDVERTYQERQFFRNPDIVRILSRVLFVWCKEFPEISYQQGMNEVGASVIWVYFNAAVNPNTKYKEYDGIIQELQQKYLFLHSNQHAEADIYSLFDKMLNSGHKQMFRAENQNKLDINPNSKNNSPILQRIIKLTDIKFKMVDAELFKHIKLNQVGMRSFLLRWIRCIHTREFELEDSFVLWDNIFLAYHFEPAQGMYFIDCTILAMLMYLRDVALKKDSSFLILQLFQKYPKVQGKSLQDLVHLAWNVKENLDTGFQKQVEKKKEVQVTKPISNTAISPKLVKKEESLLEQAPKKYISNMQIESEKKQPKKPQKVHKNQTKQQKPTQDKNFSKQIKPLEFTITFTNKQWKEIESLMQKSIEQNTDLESRSLALKVMKMFSQKEEQEIKRIESSKNLIDQ